MSCSCLQTPRAIFPRLDGQKPTQRSPSHWLGVPRLTPEALWLHWAVGAMTVRPPLTWGLGPGCPFPWVSLPRPLLSLWPRGALSQFSTHLPEPWAALPPSPPPPTPWPLPSPDTHWELAGHLERLLPPPGLPSLWLHPSLLLLSWPSALIPPVSSSVTSMFIPISASNVTATP